MTFEEDHLTRPHTVEVNVFMGSKVFRISTRLK